MNADTGTHFVTKSFSDLTTNELFEIYKLRAEIFVVEQNCAYQDVDEKDLKASHVMLFEDGKLIGYSRLIPPGISYDEASIGRVSVAKTERYRGLGRQLMEYSIRETIESYDVKRIAISAQCYLRTFYTELGFEAQGEDYLEDEIPHVKMLYVMK